MTDILSVLKEGRVFPPPDFQKKAHLKTRSGKTMRWLLRDIAARVEVGETTTLKDYSVLARLREEEE